MNGETVDSLRVHVRRGLDRFCMGLYFMEYGLQETVPLIPDGADEENLEASGLTDLNSPFQIFLRAVATEIVKDKIDVKSRKKMVKEYYGVLQAFQDEWVEYIRKNMRKKKIQQNKSSSSMFSSPEPISKSWSKSAASAAGGGGGGGGPTGGDDGGAAGTPLSKEKGKKRGPYKKRKLKEVADASPPTPIIPNPNKRQKVDDVEAARREFEQEKIEIMSRVPRQNKELFNKVGFAKWGKGLLPAMVLNPYDVPPGDIRQQWMKMYENVVQKDRVDSTGHLVWWINSDMDDQGTYSVVPHNGFLTYEEGAKKGMHELPKNLKRLLDKGKELNARQQEMVDSLSILNEMALQAPEEREHPRSNFQEEDYWGLGDEDDGDEDEDQGDKELGGLKGQEKKNKYSKLGDEAEEEELLDDEDDLLDASDSNDKKTTKKKKKNKKRKKLDHDEEIVYDDIVEEVGPVPEKKKKKKKKLKKMEEVGITNDNSMVGFELEQPVAQSKAGAETDVSVVNHEMPLESATPVGTAIQKVPVAQEKPPPPLEDIMDEPSVASADSALVDSDYGGDYVHDDDDEQLKSAVDAASGIKKKVKKLKGAKKKDKDANNQEEKKIKKKRKERKKKIPKEPKKRTKAAEQRDLERCEEEYLPLIESLLFAKEAKDIETIQEVLVSLLPVAEKFSASFFQEYEIPKLMKSTKTVLEESENSDTSTYRKLWNRMKASYTVKVQELPEGFKAKKGKGAKNMESASEKAPETDQPKKGNACSNKEGDEGPSSRVATPTIKTEPVAPMTEPSLDTKHPSAALPAKVPVKEGKRRNSADSDQLSKSLEKVSAAKPKPKSFSVMDFMSKKKENKCVSSGAPDRVSSTSTGTTVNKKAAPSWVTTPLPSSFDDSFADCDRREDRLFALKFLLQAAAHFPNDKGKTNQESIARSLEMAIYEWSESLQNWADAYWDKVHSIVAALTGKREIGTLVSMIMEGSFASPKSIVTLSFESLEKSFEGLPLSLTGE